jgi:hypothetical protein
MDKVSVDEIHPLNRNSSAALATVGEPLDALLIFEERVATLVSGDYGDFMRTVQTYFLEMISTVGTSVAEARDRLIWMEEYLQYRPNWDIDSTRDRLLVDIQQLKKTVASI